MHVDAGGATGAYLFVYCSRVLVCYLHDLRVVRQQLQYNIGDEWTKRTGAMLSFRAERLRRDRPCRGPPASPLAGRTSTLILGGLHELASFVLRHPPPPALGLHVLRDWLLAMRSVNVAAQDPVWPLAQPVLAPARQPHSFSVFRVTMSRSFYHQVCQAS